MGIENAQGVPMVTAGIVLLAIAFLFGLSFAFKGSVHF